MTRSGPREAASDRGVAAGLHSRQHSGRTLRRAGGGRWNSGVPGFAAGRLHQRRPHPGRRGCREDCRLKAGCPCVVGNHAVARVLICLQTVPVLPHATVLLGCDLAPGSSRRCPNRETRFVLGTNSPCRPPKVHVRERCYIHRQSLAERTKLTHSTHFAGRFRASKAEIPEAICSASAAM